MLFAMTRAPLPQALRSSWPAAIHVRRLYHPDSRLPVPRARRHLSKSPLQTATSVYGEAWSAEGWFRAKQDAELSSATPDLPLALVLSTEECEGLRRSCFQTMRAGPVDVGALGRLRRAGCVRRSRLRPLRYQPHEGRRHGKAAAGRWLSRFLSDRCIRTNSSLTSGGQHGLVIVTLGLLPRGHVVRCGYADLSRLQVRRGVGMGSDLVPVPRKETARWNQRT